jgi:hypothetical protein
MMMRTLPFSVVLAAAGMVYAQTTPQPANKKRAPQARPVVAGAKPAIVLEPKAIDLLKAASSRLAAARSLAFTAVVTYESPSRLGPPLEYTTRSEVLLQRPDKLRVITSGDGPASDFYYDGKAMMAFAPAENLLAVAAAPPTLDAALKQAYTSAAIYFPFSDVIVADPYKDLAADGLDLAFFVGQSKVVGGTTTDVVAYVTGGVFLQIWIGAEDKLPRMLNAVYLDDPQRLRHRLEMSDWKLDVNVPNDAFALSNIANAKRIKFAHPNPKVPPGARPATKPSSGTEQ